MKNEASKTRSLKIAFVVNADHLRRLATVLGEASKQREYTVGFSDGTSVRYDDVEDIIKLPNSEEHSITSLIAGTPEEGNQTAFVTLRKSDPESPTVEYTLGGPQRNVVYLGAQLDDWVAAIRQWYSFARSFEAAGAVFAFTALFAPFIVWGYAFQFLLPQSVRTLPWVKYLVIILYVAEYGIFKLFPRGTFAIGWGATREQFLAAVRWVVIVTLPLSILAGVITRLMTRHL